MYFAETVADPSITSIGTAIVTSLVAVTAALWRMVMSFVKETREKYDKCEESHKEATEKIIEFSGELGEMKGRLEGIEALSSKVIDTVREALKDERTPND